VREIRLHGSEGGGIEINRSSRPLSGTKRESSLNAIEQRVQPKHRRSDDWYKHEEHKGHEGKALDSKRGDIRFENSDSAARRTIAPLSFPGRDAATSGPFPMPSRRFSSPANTEGGLLQPL
jgi:hypothetical protein